VRIRRPDRVVAASLLTALGACLALLAQPSAASTLDSYDISATIRYGCAQHGEDSFVEVGLHAMGHDSHADRELVLQVGLAGPESPDSTAVFPEGGPSLVTLGDKPIKVRLAGPVHDDDHVFLRQVDQSEVITLPLQKTCHRIKPTNFGLAEPAVQVAAKSCTAGSQANLQVTLENPNEVDRQLEKIGIEQIDYTVLLVRQDGLLAGPDPTGTLLSFDEPSTSVVMLRHVVTKPARYEVRVIALDGAVVTSDSIRLSCASTGTPGPSSTSRPTPSVPVTPSPTSTRPPPSTATHTATPTVTHRPTSPATSSSAPVSSAPASSAPASSAPPTTSQPGPPVTSSPAGGVPGPTASTSSSRSAGPTPSSSAVQPPNSSPPSSSAVAAPSSSSPSPEPSIIRLVEPRAKYGGLPVFQKDVALVVLVFSAALSALVGATVVNARRR
jgi:hypothetical protein